MLINEKFIYNYSNALFNLAIETKKINHFLEVSNIIIELFEKEPNYIKLINNNNIKKKERKKILKKTFKKNIDKLILNTFFLLIDRNSFCYIIKIFKRLRNLININNNIYYGNIYSVQPLTKKQILIIQTKLNKKFGYNIKLINKIDLSLLGGIIIEIQNKIIDGSISGQLKKMKKKLINKK